MIPGWGRSNGEGIGSPHQHSWAFLVAQLVKNLPAMWETWVQSLDWEDPLEKGMATHSSPLAWRIPMDRGAWWATVHGVAKSQTRLSKQHTHTHTHIPLESKRARLSTQVSDSESLAETSHMLPTSSTTWLTFCLDI